MNICFLLVTEYRNRSGNYTIVATFFNHLIINFNDISSVQTLLVALVIINRQLFVVSQLPIGVKFGLMDIDISFS